MAHLWGWGLTCLSLFQNVRFKAMLVDTAFDGVEEKRGLKLDRKGV